MNRHIKNIFEEDGFYVENKGLSIESSNNKGKPDEASKELIEHLTFMLGKNYQPKKDISENIISEQKEKLPGKIDLSSHEYDIATIVEYLNWHMKRISKNVIGRDDIIRQAFFAILTGEHMLLLSRTGMAKSFLANYIFQSFEGARVFSSQASKDQTPDNYFGPYNIEEFKKGKIRHNIKGSIIEANLVFLDEFFDASDVVLRSLLSVLNERKFVNGSEQIDVAVHTAIATANYMRMNEVTEAVLDRFTYKAIIPENSNVYNQLLIDQTYSFSHGKPIIPDKKIYFDQILFLYDIIKNKNSDFNVQIPDLVYFMKNIIVNKFIGEMRKSDHNFFVSPRKQAKVSDFLKAYALSQNRFIVEIEDIKEIYLSLCTLNSYVSVMAKDKSEKDIYIDAYQQTMVHFKRTGALDQIEYLLHIREVFQELRENPEKREEILGRKSLIQSLMNLFRKIFANKSISKEDEEKLTVESIKKNILDLSATVEEVQELKDGILKDFRDVY